MTEPITFGKPPVNEVVLGRTFLNRPDFLAPYFGVFWGKIRERFPTIEQAQPVFSPQELVQVNPMTLLPRVWYISADQAMLAQLQQNRFYYNWRQRPNGIDYVRFPALLRESLGLWDILNEVSVDLTGRAFQTTAGEISYVNFIEIKDATATEVAQKTLRDFFWSHEERYLKPPTGFSRSLHFSLPDEKSTLEVTLMVAKNLQTGADAIKLELTVRGAISDEDPYEKWIVAAHDFLIAAFKDLTSPQMHAIWELKT